MERLTSASGPGEQLAEDLSRVAADPDQTRHLHEILGGYCHQSRNLLNNLKMSLYLAQKESDPLTAEFWRGLEPRYEVVEQYFDRVQQICRPLRLTLVKLPLRLLIEDRLPAWNRELASKGRRMRIDPPTSSDVGLFDPAHLGQGFDALVAWRALIGDSSCDLRLRWTTEPGWFHLEWDEPTRSDSAINGTMPHHAGVPTDPGEGPSALTIPLLTRILSLHGGRLETNAHPGWQLRMRWPLDSPTPT
ncbi:MAG: hypothetical protein NVSMB9_30380 [Isosphaeraceae bacterium]